MANLPGGHERRSLSYQTYCQLDLYTLMFELSVS